MERHAATRRTFRDTVTLLEITVYAPRRDTPLPLHTVIMPAAESMVDSAQATRP